MSNLETNEYYMTNFLTLYTLPKYMKQDSEQIHFDEVKFEANTYLKSKDRNY